MKKEVLIYFLLVRRMEVSLGRCWKINWNGCVAGKSLERQCEVINHEIPVVSSQYFYAV